MCALTVRKIYIFRIDKQLKAKYKLPIEGSIRKYNTTYKQQVRRRTGTESHT